LFYLNSSSIYLVTKRNSTVKLRKADFSPVASRAVWRSRLSDGYSIITIFQFKGPVQCFSRQVIMNKCFTLNSEKNGADSCCRFWEKRKKPFHKMMSLCPSYANSETEKPVTRGQFQHNYIGFKA